MPGLLLITSGQVFPDLRLEMSLTLTLTDNYLPNLILAIL
jgi:hypothetical protein